MAGPVLLPLWNEDFRNYAIYSAQYLIFAHLLET